MTKKSSTDRGAAISAALLLCGKLIRTGVVACSALAATAIALISIVSSAVFPVTGDEHLSLYTVWGDGAEMVLFGAFLALVVSALIYLVWKYSLAWNQRVLVAVMLSLAGIVGIIWVAQQQAVTSSFPDSARLIEFAREASAGDWSSFIDSRHIERISEIPDDAHLYFKQYPFQSGVFLYFYLVFRLFGDRGVIALQLINVISNLIMLCCVYCSSCILSEDKRVRSMTLMISALFLPLTLSASLPYGNSLGFALGSTFIYLNLRAIHSPSTSERVALIFVSLPLLCLAAIIKSTITLFAIASIISWLYALLRERRGATAAMLAASVATLLVANAACGLPIAILEHKVGYSFGEGMPKTSWFAIGLSESTHLEEQPGWWDFEALQIFSETNGDIEEQSAAAKESIANCLRGYASDPLGALSFFTRKVATEWAEPTFGSLYYSASNQQGDGTFFDPDEALGELGVDAIVVAMDGLQIVVYAACAVRLLYLLFRPSTRLGVEEFLLISVFFVGAGCYLLWEAKSVYLMPFFVWLIPLACNTIRMVILGIARPTGKEP